MKKYSLVQIEKMLSKITPGPWKKQTSGDGKCTGINGPGEPKSEIWEPIAVIEHDDRTSAGDREAKANIAFFMAAPAIIRQLLDFKNLHNKD